MLGSRPVVTSALAVSLVAWGSLAHARPNAQQCIDAHATGQKRRIASDLVGAEESFLICSDSACPRVVRADCGPWLKEVRAQTPSIVVAVRTASGDDITRASLYIDGKKVAERVDGLPLQLNPGVRRLRVVSADHDPVEKELTVRAGEQLRAVDVTIHTPDEPMSEPDTRRAPPTRDDAANASGPPIGAVLVGVAGLGFATVGGYVLFDGLRDHDDLSDACKQASDCGTPARDAEFDDNNGDIVLGQVLAGTGLGLVAISLIWWSSSGSPDSTAAIGVQPIRGGGAATWLGRF